MKIEIAGQNALIVYFAEQASAAVSARIQSAVAKIRAALPGLIVDLVPSYASLLVIFDIERCDYYAIKSRLVELLQNLDDNDASGGELVTLPVYYAAESGPDLELIA